MFGYLCEESGMEDCSSNNNTYLSCMWTKLEHPFWYNALHVLTLEVNMAINNIVCLHKDKHMVQHMYT